jgi:hypothetical protein
MPKAIALSRNARTLITQRLAGEEIEVTDETITAYRELVRAGFVRSDPSREGHFRLTATARKREREFLPNEGPLSEVAVAVLEHRLAGNNEVNDANRAGYRELEAAGLMDACHSFAGGDESIYRITEEGWARRFEFISPSSEVSSSLPHRSVAGFPGRLAGLMRAILFRARSTRVR